MWGAIKRSASGSGFESVFKNASFWTNEKHWSWALSPNKREAASFLKENLLPIESSGCLNFVSEHSGGDLLKNSELGFDVFFADGHTEKQMIPIISYKGQKIAFTADLLPTAGHVPVPYVMGYDVRPLVSMSEKELFLKEAVEKNYYLFLEHDPYNQIITLKKTDKGIRINEFLKCKDVF